MALIGKNLWKPFMVPMMALDLSARTATSAIAVAEEEGIIAIQAGAGMGRAPPLACQFHLLTTTGMRDGITV
jgi:hypothetical protein